MYIVLSIYWSIYCIFFCTVLFKTETHWPWNYEFLFGRAPYLLYILNERRKTFYNKSTWNFVFRLFSHTDPVWKLIATSDIKADYTTPMKCCLNFVRRYFVVKSVYYCSWCTIRFEFTYVVTKLSMVMPCTVQEEASVCCIRYLKRCECWSFRNKLTCLCSNGSQIKSTLSLEFRAHCDWISFSKIDSATCVTSLPCT